tara:strand:+ start:238 stop:978 length:741 start_codon:yes stop_codon:yes gene_type:complete
MALSVDTVYQRVLALANKEQRGYITPQEFNLLANKAQLIIFEQYFYDIDIELNEMGIKKAPGNSAEYSNRIDILAEKIAPFEQWKVAMSAVSGNELTLPISTAVHKLGTVFYTAGVYDIEVERVEKNELHYMERTALAAPTDARPVYVRKTNTIVKLFPASPTVSYTTANVTCNYVAKPIPVIWGYTVVNSQAMYDLTTSTDFELHESEETDLVYKILELSGITLNKPGLVQMAGAEENEIIQKKQ